MGSVVAPIRSAYKLAKDEIQDCLDNIRIQMDLASSSADKVFVSLSGESDGSEGYFVDFFNSKVSVVYWRWTSLYGSLASTNTKLTAKQDIVRSRLQYLNGLCANEEHTGNLYSVADIVFPDAR